MNMNRFRDPPRAREGPPWAQHNSRRQDNRDPPRVLEGPRVRVAVGGTLDPMTHHARARGSAPRASARVRATREREGPRAPSTGNLDSGARPTTRAREGPLSATGAVSSPSSRPNHTRARVRRRRWWKFALPTRPRALGLAVEWWRGRSNDHDPTTCARAREMMAKRVARDPRPGHAPEGSRPAWMRHRFVSMATRTRARAASRGPGSARTRTPERRRARGYGLLERSGIAGRARKWGVFRGRADLERRGLNKFRPGRPPRAACESSRPRPLGYGGARFEA